MKRSFFVLVCHFSKLVFDLPVRCVVGGTYVPFDTVISLHAAFLIIALDDRDGVHGIEIVSNSQPTHRR